MYDYETEDVIRFLGSMVPDKSLEKAKAAGLNGAGPGSSVISHTVFSKSFGKCQFPHKSANLFFILVTVKDKLTNLWGS